MRRPRVLHVVVGGDIGGAERLLVALATRPERSRADHQVALFTPNRRLAKFLTDSGLQVHDRGHAAEHPLAYLWRSLGPVEVSWLARLMDREQVDIVHTHTLGSHVLGTRAALQSGRPQLRTEHHVMHYRDVTSSWFTRWAAARTQRFAAVSEYVLRVLSREVPDVAARTTVVRNGVDTRYFSPLAPPRRQFLAGVVSRLTRWKRVHLAIEAATLAKTDLLVVGDGEQRRSLERLAARRGAAVTFVGHQSDPRPFIAQCDAILATADNEPLGLSVLEALSMQRPVIAFAGGGIPEIVEPGVTGILVAEPTAAAFAEAIHVLRNDREALAAMGASARASVERRFGIDSMCEAYGALYEGMRSAP